MHMSKNLNKQCLLLLFVTVSGHLKKVIISCVLPTQGLALSGRPTATLGTDVLRLPAQGCRTVFQPILGISYEQFKPLLKTYLFGQ